MGRLGKKRKKQNWPKGFRVWVTLRSNDNTDRNDEGQRGTDFKRKITNSILDTEVSRSSYGKGNQIWSLTNLELYSDVTRKPSPSSWSETPPSSLSPSATTITYFLHSTSWHNSIFYMCWFADYLSPPPRPAPLYNVSSVRTVSFLSLSIALSWVEDSSWPAVFQQLSCGIKPFSSAGKIAKYILPTRGPLLPAQRLPPLTLFRN